jgi:lysophospholipase
MLSYQLINDTRGGLSYTWSSIALDREFADGDMPMPILVADGRNPGEKIIGTNATVFEINPFELGTFDPTIFGFIPLEFLGSAFRAGRLPRNESCVRGFDNAGFLMGTSSSLFNQFALNLPAANLPDFIEERLEGILGSIGNDNNDIAEYKPNPFFQYSTDTSPFAEHESLTLVDGGEDLQNIPLHPLIQPERQVDVVFAIDSSADNEFAWPNGTSMVASYERSLNATGIANNTAFPAVPDQNTFVNLGLNNRPTFFGCASSNMTGPSPLIVYLPNAPYSTFSNVSTFTMSYEHAVRDAIIENGYNVATMGNATRDEDWPACVGCAILSRSFERTGTAVPDICLRCFSEYCWDGTLNSTEPATYEPELILDGQVDARNAASGRLTLSMFGVLAAMIATMMAF